MIVGAEAFSCAEITQLSSRGHVPGRLSVDVDGDPPVVQCGLATHDGRYPAMAHHEESRCTARHSLNQRQPRQNAFKRFDPIAAVKERGVRGESELVAIAPHEIETEDAESTEVNGVV